MNYFRRGDWLLRVSSSRSRLKADFKLCRFLQDDLSSGRCLVEFWFYKYHIDGQAQYLSTERDVHFASLIDFLNFGPEFESVEPHYLKEIQVAHT
jgi:hypothetical protein